jgi:outer membrane protein assembly factor BamB
VSDFITGLRADLVDAATRQQRRGRVGRAARPLHPRAWRPAAAVGAMAVAVSIAAVVLAVLALSPPTQQAGRPHVIAEVRVGGQPQDAVLASGSLWVADYGGDVVRIDPTGRRVLDRIPIGGNAVSIAAGAAGVWVMSTDTENGADRSHLSRIDPRTGRRVDRIPVRGTGGVVAVGAGGVWLFPSLHRGGLERIDPASTAVTARASFGTGVALAAAGDTLWALGNDGTVIAIDGGSGRVIYRLPQIAPSPDTPKTLVADATGAWVLSSEDEALVHIVDGRVVQRITVRSALGPLTVADGAVWVATGDTARLRYSLARIDPDTGKTTATLDLGRHQAKALVPSPQGLWVIAGDGTALLIRT